MKVQPATTLLAAVAIAAIVAGCGGGNNSSSSLTKEQFLAQATKACAHAAENAPELAAFYLQRIRAKERHGADTSNSYTGLVKTVILPAIERQVAAVRQLDAPDGEEGDVKAILDTELKELGEVAKLKHIVSRFQYERYLLKSANQFRAYGLEGCANG